MILERAAASRAPDDEDRRAMLLSLTQRGAKLMSSRAQKETSLRRWMGRQDDEELEALRWGLTAWEEL